MKYLIIIIIFNIGAKSFPQDSYEYFLGTNGYDISYSSFEENGNYYIFGNYNTTNAIIIKFSNSTNLISKNIIKQDTGTIFYCGTNSETGNLLVIGGAATSSSIYLMNQLYVCEFTKNLDLVKEYYYSILPEQYDYLDIFDMVINQDDNIVLAGHFDTYDNSSGNSFVLIELNRKGELINYNNDSCIYYTGRYMADLLNKKDGTGYYYFGSGSYDWVEYDNDLNYVNGDYFIDWPHYLGSYVTAKNLPSGNIGFVMNVSDNTYFYDLKIQIYTESLECIKDTVLVEEGRQAPAEYKGFDFVDPDNMWILTFNDWTFPNETYKIFLFDSLFHVKGSKFFGGSEDYTFHYLLATSDGGCLLNGQVRQDWSNIYKPDIYITKVMPEDILTGNDEKIFTEFKDVLVYPNPFTDKIMLNTDRNNLSFNLFNVQGQLIYQGVITEKNTNKIRFDNLQNGIYIYSITNSAGKAIDGGKLLKK